MRIILMLTGAVVLFLVSGIGYIWITTPKQLTEVAIIKADTKPYKVLPASPGGEVINNIESSLLNTLDNPQDIPPGGEVLSPPDPTPELPPIDVTISGDTNLSDDEAAFPVAEETKIVSGEDNQQADQENSTPISEDQQPDATVIENIAQSDEQDMAISAEEDTDTDQQQEGNDQSDTAPPETSESTETATIAGVPLPKPSLNRVRSTTGTPLYRVQLAAFKNEQKAMQVAALLTEKHRSRLGQSSVGITLHDAAEQGLFWRVVTDPMPRGDASNLCKTLKSVGQDCILRKLD